jgi:Family of unknown function (DUF5808)
VTIYAVLFYSLVFLLIGGVQAALPAFSRRTIFFSVTVPEHFRETTDARSILRQFRGLILLSAVGAEMVALAGIYAVPGKYAPVGLMFAAIWVLVAGASGAYARARNQTRPHSVAPSTERTATLAAQSEGLLGSYLALILAVLPMIAAALFAWSRWSEIPDTIALWNAFAVNGFLNILLLLRAVGLLHETRRGSPLRSVNLRVIVALMGVNSVATALFTALRWIDPAEQFSRAVFPIVWLLLIAGITAWGLRKASPLRDSADTTPDECWKLGLFYYNPEDPALLVERRFGLGYTLNFAKPLSWVVTTVLFLLPLVLILRMVARA